MLFDAKGKQQIRLVLRILQTGEASSKRDLPSPPYKLTEFALVSGTIFGKSGADMSTPVYPVATPLITSCH